MKMQQTIAQQTTIAGIFAVVSEAVGFSVDRDNIEQVIVERAAPPVTIDFSDERLRWEAEEVRTPRDRDRLLNIGFRWDNRNRVLFAPSDEVALKGMELA